MGKLVGLISSGIGLAMEAKISHQSSGNNSSAKDVSLGKSFREPSQVSNRASPNVYQPSSNEEAYQDLQAYADYQSNLSHHLSTDMQREENYRRYLAENPRTRPARNTYGRDVSFYAHEIPDQRFLPASPYLNAVNVAAAGVGFAPGIAPMVVSMVVPIAVRAAKDYQTQRQSSSFLDRANLELFVPHGLFAMVLTFSPDQMQDTHGAPGEVQLPVSAPLVYPEDHRRTQQTGLKKVGHFIADYGDRRAQARFAHINPDSSLVGPVPAFEGRWGDLNHPANSGGLKSLLTGIPDDSNSRKQDKQDRTRDRKSHRRRRESSSSGSPRRGGLLSTALGAAGGASEFERRGISSGGRPSLVGMTRGIANGPGRQNQSLIRGIKGIGMKTDILYLMITNNTEDSTSISSTRSQTSSTYRPPPPSPFYNQHTNSASDTRLKSSNLDQKEIYLSSYRDLTPSDTDQQQNNDTRLGRQDQVASGPSPGYFNRHDAPPPTYREAMPTRYYDRMRKNDEEFCVPTL